MNDGNVARIDFIELGNISYRIAGSIHKRLWAGKRHLFGSKSTFGIFRSKGRTVAEGGEIPMFANVFDTGESDIVPRVLVFFSGVSEPDNEVHSNM